MLPHDKSQVDGVAASVARYYKSHGSRDPVVYVQEEGLWRIYADGRVIRESTGTIPEPMLAQSEEITRDQAEKLIELGRREVERIKAEKAEAQASGTVPAKEWTQTPSGLGGWLIVPVITLCAALLRSLGWMSSDVATLFTQAGWSASASAGAGGYHRWLGPTIVYELLVNTVMIILPIVLLVMLFQKRWFVPRLMVGFYVLLFLLVLIDSVIIVTHGQDMLSDAAVRAEVGWSTRSVAAALTASLVGGAIWAIYFLVSKRVKNTFVK